MSRVSSTAKRYSGSSYTSHYSSYGSSLTPSLGSYERDKLPYKSSSSGYSSSSYLSSSASRSRNYSSSFEPDRGRPIPRTDLLDSRRSESLSRTPAKGYGSGLNGGSGYSSYNYSSAPTSYLSSSPVSSSISLSRRKSVSQSDLTHNLSALGLSETSSGSGLKQSYQSRGTGASDSYSSTRSSYGLSRSSTDGLKSSSSRFSSSYRSTSPVRESLVRAFMFSRWTVPTYFPNTLMLGLFFTDSYIYIALLSQVLHKCPLAQRVCERCKECVTFSCVSSELILGSCR